MYALLLILVVLLRATNAIQCWQGNYAKPALVGVKQGMKLGSCPKGLTRCMKMDCSIDEETLREHPLPPIFPAGTKNYTETHKTCYPAELECELPELMKAYKKSCKVSCCDSNACNGTLGLHSFGTVAAMVAFFAVFFVRWN